jgi:hypothetical protein
LESFIAGRNHATLLGLGYPRTAPCRGSWSSEAFNLCDARQGRHCIERATSPDRIDRFTVLVRPVGIECCSASSARKRAAAPTMGFPVSGVAFPAFSGHVPCRWDAARRTHARPEARMEKGVFASPIEIPDVHGHPPISSKEVHPPLLFSVISCRAAAPRLSNLDFLISSGRLALVWPPCFLGVHRDGRGFRQHSQVN